MHLFPRHARRLLSAVCLLGSMTAAAACQSASPDAVAAPHTDVSVPAERPAPPIPDPVPLSLGLDAYRPTDAEIGQISKAINLLTDQCMQRYGYRYTAGPPLTAFGPASRTDLRYGIHDAKLAAERGYHPAGDAAVFKDEGEARRQASASMNETERLVLTGGYAGRPGASAGGSSSASVAGRELPKGGCLGEGTQRVTAGRPLVSDLVQDLNDAAYAKAEADPKTVAAIGAWSTCMAQKGFAYAKPMDAPNDPRFSGPSSTPVEISTALADIDCRTQTNLIGIWYAAETAYQNALVEKNATALAAAKQAKDAALKQAAAVMGGTPAP
ncbi:hypothetical protein [Kitasatospora sp. NPDC090091]|uniref:hypothetical protein n=1 Tax=Kitasatospora sp. NPDC090091 TaxID=3364081 RepID=UPI0037F618CA